MWIVLKELLGDGISEQTGEKSASRNSPDDSPANAGSAESRKTDDDSARNRANNNEISIFPIICILTAFLDNLELYLNINDNS